MELQNLDCEIYSRNVKNFTEDVHNLTNLYTDKFSTNNTEEQEISIAPLESQRKDVRRFTKIYATLNQVKIGLFSEIEKVTLFATAKNTNFEYDQGTTVKISNTCDSFDITLLKGSEESEIYDLANKEYPLVKVSSIAFDQRIIKDVIGIKGTTTFPSIKFTVEGKPY